MKISIEKKLKEKKMTRWELAKRIGVTYPTIDKIYKGVSTSIKFEILESICKTLECTPNDIITSDDPQINRILEYYKKLSKTSDSNSDA